MTTEIDADRTAQTEGSSEARIDFSVWAHERARHFEWLAEKGLPQPGRDPKRLIGAMRYAVLGGGKRIRPLLCYAAGAVTGAPQPVLDGAALALECIHGYSLVHDDMPAMDNDTLRRGRPTVHVQYGEACAMLAGDALQTEAFSVLSKIDAAPEVVVRLLRTLSRASGVAGMAGGQAIDLEMVGAHPDEGALLRMQSMKTGALIVAAVLMGAQSGRWEELSEASKGGLALYGHSLGIAFQVVDDILDCTQDTTTLGKTAGKDEKDDKPTWVSILGLEGARERARALRADAQRGLDLIAQDPSVPEGALVRLTEIADYVVARSY